MKKYALSFFLVFSLLFILCPIQNVSASDASTLELGDDIVATSSYRVKSKTKKQILTVHGQLLHRILPAQVKMEKF